MAERRKPSSYTSWEEYEKVYNPKTDFEWKFVWDCYDNKVSSVRSTLNSSDEKERKKLANLVSNLGSILVGDQVANRIVDPVGLMPYLPFGSLTRSPTRSLAISMVISVERMVVNQFRNSYYDPSQPVLYWAVTWNYYELAALLLSAGADPNVEDKNGETAMDKVWVWKEEEKSAEDCLMLINLLEKFEGRPKIFKDRHFDFVCSTNNLSSVQFTLQSSDEDERKKMSNLMDRDQNCHVLHAAVREQKFELAALLLSGLANPNRKDSNGLTALDCMLEYNKNVLDHPKWIYLLEKYNGEQETHPNRFAASKKLLQFVLACSNNNISSVQSTLKSSEEDQNHILIRLLDHEKHVPVLHAAVLRRHFDTAVELIKKGADPYVRDNQGKSAIDHMLSTISDKIGPLVKLLNPTFLWTEVDKQSLETIEDLKDKLSVKWLDPLKPAPDGTTTLHMSLFRGNEDIIDIVMNRALEFGQDVFNIVKILVAFDAPDQLTKLLQNQIGLTQDQWKQLSDIATKSDSNAIQKQFHGQMTITHDNNSTNNYSELVKASEMFPVFNDKSEAVFKILQGGELSLESNVVELCTDLWPKHMLGDQIGQLRQEFYIFEYKFDHKNEPLICQSEHKLSANPWSCQAIFDLIFMATLLGKFLRTKSTLQALRPMLYVIGSVVESTRIGTGSELDVTLSFDNLPGHCFELGPNAFNLQLSSFGLEHLKSNKLERFIKNGNQLDYVKLLMELMKQLKLGLVDMKPQLPSRLSFNFNYSPKQCTRKQCQPDTSISNGFFPYKHCKSCLPSICHTKLGPCIIAQWNNGWFSSTKVLTMDLIMVFNHQSSSLELFRHMITTLFEETPLDWRKTFKSYLERDRILPEAMYREQRSPSKAKDPKGNNTQVAMKLLHYGDFDNCIIRPGQVLEIDQLQGNIRDLYLMTKIWKARFPEANFKSFMVKKILLDPALRDRAQADKEGTWKEIMNGPLKPFAKKNMSEEEFAENLKIFEEKCK